MSSATEMIGDAKKFCQEVGERTGAEAGARPRVRDRRRPVLPRGHSRRRCRDDREAGWRRQDQPVSQFPVQGRFGGCLPRKPQRGLLEAVGRCLCPLRRRSESTVARDHDLSRRADNQARLSRLPIHQLLRRISGSITSGPPGGDRQQARNAAADGRTGRGAWCARPQTTGGRPVAADRGDLRHQPDARWSRQSGTRRRVRRRGAGTGTSGAAAAATNSSGR